MGFVVVVGRAGAGAPALSRYDSTSRPSVFEVAAV